MNRALHIHPAANDRAPLLDAARLCKHFGGIQATNEVDLQIQRGQLHALIGPNGAGKTTLIAQLAGQLRPERGRITFDGRDITHLPPHRRARLGLARSFQRTSVVAPMTLLENVQLAVLATTGRTFGCWQPAAHCATSSARARHYLDEVGLASRVNARAEQLSHGEQRQLEMAMALATTPKLLLLDEPMAGMSGVEGARMIELLSRVKQHTTMLLIEHDMDAVFHLADRLSVLVDGQLIATDTVDNIRNNPRVQRAYLG